MQTVFTNNKNNNNNTGAGGGSGDDMSRRTVYYFSEAFNRCGIRNYMVYIPAFKKRYDKTVENVIPHWTYGISSFFIVPKEITYEWFCSIVAGCNENNVEDCDNNPVMMHVYRDGDSFIQNILIPNVEQICENICIPRGNVDGSLIEMFMAGANMSISADVLQQWQTLVKETILKCQYRRLVPSSNSTELCDPNRDPTCDCKMCECDSYSDNYDSYSQSTATTDCSGDPICNSDTDSDWE